MTIRRWSFSFSFCFFLWLFFGFVFFFGFVSANVDRDACLLDLIYYVAITKRNFLLIFHFFFLFLTKKCFLEFCLLCQRSLNLNCVFDRKTNRKNNKILFFMHFSTLFSPIPTQDTVLYNASNQAYEPKK